jgi:predicted nucleotidyltransferase
MISKNDKQMILKYAKKYRLARVILFGSSRERTDAHDIDIGVIGPAPESFFDFCGNLHRDLSKPLDVVDLSKDCLFNRLVERDGAVLYGSASGRFPT